MRNSSIGTEVAEPYAKAFMSLADGQDLADRFGQDAAYLQQLLQESTEFAEFLGSPIINSETKKSVLRQVAESEIHPYTLNFLMLLVDRGRILFLEQVCQRYQTLLRERNQTALAEVTSTVELTQEQRQSIIDRVKAFTNSRQVELKTQLDPNIIGGVIVKVGSQVLDASLRGQLRRLAVRLSAG
jgi:F-type H+-transporting ATPase subunit delta